MAFVKFPTLNLSEIVVILKTEGSAEVALIARKLFKDTKVFNSWDRIMRILEFDIIPVLAKGGDISSIRPFLGILVKEGKILTDAFTAVGSFVPGPVGIVCSLIRAIACFYGGNIPMGLLELLGCIPGAKAATKGGSKIAEKIGERLMGTLKKNKDFEQYCAKAQLLLGKVSELNSTFIITKLNDIRNAAGNAMNVGTPKFLELTAHQITEKGITKFGSVLMP